MIILLAVALLGDFTPPREGAEVFHHGIWADVGATARHARGSVVGRWYLAAGGDRARLQITDFGCSSPVGRRDCRFTLIREGGPVEVRGTMVSDRLTCTARFQRGGNGRWFVDRSSGLWRPGNSSTTMRCQGA